MNTVAERSKSQTFPGDDVINMSDAMLFGDKVPEEIEASDYEADVMAELAELVFVPDGDA